MKSTISEHWEKAAWATIVLLALPYVVLTVPQLLGQEAHVVNSGSMEPNMPEGSLLFTQDPQIQSLSEGDVIVFRSDHPNITEELVTHRIISVDEGEFTREFQTQGDANPDPDPGMRSAESITGLRTLHIPHLGNIIRFTQSFPLYIFLISIPAILLVRKDIKRLVENMGGQEDFMRDEYVEEDDNEEDEGTEFNGVRLS